MSSFTRRRRGQILGIALVLLALASCGGFGLNDSAPAADCVAQSEVTDLGDGALCADSGFRLSADDFSFANWGGFDGSTDNVNADILVRLYGSDAVCTEETSDDNCVLNPAAEEVLTEWKSAIAGGRCEGMATLAMRYFMHLENPADFQSGVSKSVSLVRPSLSIDQEINTWWATQFMYEVRAAAAKSREKDPVQLVNELVQGLKNNAGYTVGLYGDGFGHAVTPFAVTKKDSDFIIHIYDNNYPGKPATIKVNEKTKRWSYSGAAINPNGDTETWTGGKGTFELTPMAVRVGPFTDEFGASEDETKAMTTISIEVSAQEGEPAAGLLVAGANGKKFGIVNGQMVNEIPGAIYTIEKEEFGTSMVTIDMPAQSWDYSIHVVPVTDHVSESPRDVTVEVAAPDGMHTLIVSHRPLDNQVSSTVSDAELVMHPKKGVIFKAKTDSEVTVANNRDKAVLHVPRNGTLAETHSTFVNKDANGKVIMKKLKNAAVRKRRLASTTTTMLKRLPTTTTTVMRTTTTVPRSTTTTTLVPRTSTTLRRLTTTTTTTSVP
jgi:hypothetical protein